MITIIFGPPRAGKTALMTKFALDYMTGSNARRDLKACRAQIDALNRGGFQLSYPTDHLVFSDYTITARHGKIQSHYANGFDFGLPDPDHYTDFIVPYSRFFFDEAQKYLNSRRKDLADSVSRAYELHGHARLNVTLAVQRPKLIDLNVRELATEVIEVDELRHEYDHGIIIGSTWFCRRYEKATDALRAIDGQKVDYEPVNYDFNGNIFKHYDSFFFAPSFLNGRYRQDFDIVNTGGYGKNVDDVRRFNQEHSYRIPKGYYKGDKK